MNRKYMCQGIYRLFFSFISYILQNTEVIFQQVRQPVRYYRIIDTKDGTP